ncbi:[SSU ribosomal protein S5P]-alanine acetyltransferase [Gulbenkiania indica]|uniref:[SSU ribosomal protein S5P]-alanine acetyltransferase n=1 Tax=Gulbenkiania indica TaxID=375574 RepID=A0A0K6GY43_9NEIS|nr:GNAT family N-acetyltransferase [Gulbenkiania indica]CUA83652.1 [SSU ribosomal protein S5P]-alanine acetyltransferase [Gulbenkiania indica]
MTLAQPVLTTPRLQLVPVSLGWARALLDYHLRNRDHLSPWDPVSGDMYYTELNWTMRCRQRLRDWSDGRGAAYVLVRPEQPGVVAGVVQLSNIVRGPLQAAHLSYSIDATLEGKGYMREALEAVVALAFGPLRLHRLMANYQPHNDRSGGLLKRLGFVVEGRAPAYLFLNGAWRDHVLTARVNPDFDPAQLLA